MLYASQKKLMHGFLICVYLRNLKSTIKKDRTEGRQTVFGCSSAKSHQFCAAAPHEDYKVTPPLSLFTAGKIEGEQR